MRYQKVYLIHDILALGYDVMFMDADIAVVKDFRKYVEDLTLTLKFDSIMQNDDNRILQEDT